MILFVKKYSPLIIVICLTYSVEARENQAAIIKHASEEISIDGNLDEDVWAKIEPLNLTMFSPTYSGSLTEKSEIKIFYDDNFIYTSARFKDSLPTGIRNNSFYRDRYNEDDYFALLIVPHKYKTESGLQFIVMPSGNKEDAEISNDGYTENVNWNSYWEAAATINDEGWFAEMKIPFSELGLEQSEEVEIGIITWRLISRKNERQVFPDISPDKYVNTTSRAKFFKLENIHVGKPVYVTPYLLGGIGRESTLSESYAKYHYKNIRSNEIGLDVKYKVRSNLNLDLTFNTDFAQAEADDQQINLTRYNLFFPEKRQFFQERSGLFSFNTANERVFHSRRIGISNGEIVPILGGVRLVGSAGSWDVALLDMQTAEKNSLNLPSENFGVMRLRKQVLNKKSYIGGIVASRISNNAYNVVTGLDGVINVFDDEHLIFNLANSFDDEVKFSGKNPFDYGLIEVQWERRNLNQWSYYGSFTRMGKFYKPEMGFTTKQNYTEFSGLLHHNAFPGNNSPFQRTMFFHLEGSVTLRNTDQSILSSELKFAPAVWWKSSAYFRIGITHYYEDVDTELNFGNDVNVPIGQYHFLDAYAYYAMPAGDLLKARLLVQTGSFFDGWLSRVLFYPSWTVSPHLSLIGSYSLDVVNFNSRKQKLTAHVAQLKIEAALNIHLTLDTFIQYNSLVNILTSNVRFRYNFNEGSDLWLVYNHGINTDRYSYIPNLLLVNNQSILLKYTYTLDVN